MSDNVESNAQSRAIRVEWTLLSSALCQTMREGLYYAQHSTACESTIVHHLSKLRCDVWVEEKRVSLRRALRAIECAPADVYLIIYDKEVKLQDLPSEDASDYDLWQWARTRPEGVRFVPVDMKLCSLTIGRNVNDRNKHYYYWSRSNVHKKRVSDCEVIFASVEGVRDHIAVVPSATWYSAAERMSYGIETIKSRSPLWMSLFMVHIDDLHEAVQRICDAGVVGDEAHPYINPTNGRHLDGWICKTIKQPDLEPHYDNAANKKSFRGTLAAWDEIEHGTLGCRIYFNLAAPAVHDYYVYIPGVGPVRFEQKDFDSVDSMLALHAEIPRQSPLSSRRLWHVLYIRTKTGHVCIMRNEIPDLDSTIAADFIRHHTYSSLDEALTQHVRPRAKAAMQYVEQRLRDITPKETCQDLRERIIKLPKDAGDPLVGLANLQVSLPWLSHMVNQRCQQAGFGVCIALGVGHPLGTHAIVSHEWSKFEKTRFLEHGHLPFDAWSGAAQSKDCIVLRLQDHSTKENIMPFHYPLAFARSQYKKTVRGKRFFILGSVLDHHLHREGSARNSNYLFMQSELTHLDGELDPLPAGDKEKMKTGAHFWRTVLKATTELQHPPWAGSRPRKTFNESILRDKNTEAVHYIVNLADGTINREFERILTSAGRMRIENPRHPSKTATFDPRDYRQPFGDVLQAAWEFGYETDP